MREIKFRYYDKKYKFMWRVRSIDFSDGSARLESDENIFVYDCLQCGKERKCYSPFRYVQLSELMQYTGLKDENGIEAYHKDLISAAGYSNWIIEWNKDGWYMKTTNIDEKYYHTIPDDFIIIGNQFENPELLKEQ